MRIRGFKYIFRFVAICSVAAITVLVIPPFLGDVGFYGNVAYAGIDGPTDNNGGGPSSEGDSGIGGGSYSSSGSSYSGAESAGTGSSYSSSNSSSETSHGSDNSSSYSNSSNSSYSGAESSGSGSSYSSSPPSSLSSSGSGGGSGHGSDENTSSAPVGSLSTPTGGGNGSTDSSYSGAESSGSGSSYSSTPASSLTSSEVNSTNNPDTYAPLSISSLFGSWSSDVMNSVSNFLSGNSGSSAAPSSDADDTGDVQNLGTNISGSLTSSESGLGDIAPYGYSIDSADANGVIQDNPDTLVSVAPSTGFTSAPVSGNSGDSSDTSSSSGIFGQIGTALANVGNVVASAVSAVGKAAASAATYVASAISTQSAPNNIDTSVYDVPVSSYDSFTPVDGSVLDDTAIVQTVNLNNLTRAQLSAMGLVSYSANDIQTAGEALAGELDSSIVKKIQQGEPLTPADLQAAAGIMNVAVTRAEANAGVVIGGGSDHQYDSLSDALTVNNGSQFNAFAPKYISTTDSNYNGNPSGFDDLAESLLNGTVASKYGLDVAAPAPEANAYYNPTISNPSWGSQIVNTVGTLGGHIFGTLSGEYLLNGTAPGQTALTNTITAGLSQAGLLNPTSLADQTSVTPSGAASDVTQVADINPVGSGSSAPAATQQDDDTTDKYYDGTGPAPVPLATQVDPNSVPPLNPGTTVASNDTGAVIGNVIVQGVGTAIRAGISGQGNPGTIIGQTAANIFGTILTSALAPSAGSSGTVIQNPVISTGIGGIIGSALGYATGGVTPQNGAATAISYVLNGIGTQNPGTTATAGTTGSTDASAGSSGSNSSVFDDIYAWVAPILGSTPPADSEAGIVDEGTAPAGSAVQVGDASDDTDDEFAPTLTDTGGVQVPPTTAEVVNSAQYQSEVRAILAGSNVNLNAVPVSDQNKLIAVLPQIVKIAQTDAAPENATQAQQDAADAKTQSQVKALLDSQNLTSSFLKVVPTTKLFGFITNGVQDFSTWGLGTPQEVSQKLTGAYNDVLTSETKTTPGSTTVTPADSVPAETTQQSAQDTLNQLYPGSDTGTGAGTAPAGTAGDMGGTGNTSSNGSVTSSNPLQNIINAVIGGGTALTSGVSNAVGKVVASLVGAVSGGAASSTTTPASSDTSNGVTDTGLEADIAQLPDLSCSPQTAVKGEDMDITISWTCYDSTSADGIGFPLMGGAPQAQAVVSTDATTSSWITYGIRCSNGTTRSCLIDMQ